MADPHTDWTYDDWAQSASRHTMGVVYAFMTGVWIALAVLSGLSLPWAVVFGVAVEVVAGMYGACRAFWRATHSGGTAESRLADGSSSNDSTTKPIAPASVPRS